MASSIQTNLLLKVSADIAGAKNGLGTLNNQLSGLGSTVAKVAALIGSAFALRDVITTTQQWGKSLEDLQDTLGLSGQTVAEWVYATRVVGATVEDIGTTFGILTNKIGNSLPAIQQGTSDFDRWGIKVLDANNALMGADEILAQVRDRVRELGPGLAARQFELDMFGRSGGVLHDFLALSNEELRQMKEDLDALGLPTNVAELEAMNREGNRLGFIFDSLKIKLGSALLPVLLAVGRGLASLAGYVKVLGEALRYPLGIIKEVIDRFGKFLTQIKDQGLVIAVQSLAQDIVSRISQTLGDVGQWVSTNFPIWRAALGRLWDGMIEWLRSTGIPGWTTFFQTQIVPLGNWIVDSVPVWLTNLGELITSSIDWLRTTGMPSIATVLGEAIPGIGKWITDSIPEWATNLGTLLGSVLNWAATEFLPRLYAAFYTFVNRLPEWALGVANWYMTEAFPAISAGVTAFVNALLDGLLGPLRDPNDGFEVSFRRLVILTITQPFAMVGGIFDAIRWIIDKIEEATRAWARLQGKTSRGSGQTGIWTNPPGGEVRGPGPGPIAMARGGAGVAMGPTLFLAGEKGPEPFAFGREATGGTTIIVNVSGNVTRSEKELADIVGSEIMRRIGTRRAVAF